MEVVMADEATIHSIMQKLRRQASLTAEEVADLQSHVDQLEMRAAPTPNHDTHTSPGSHFSHHHPTMLNVAGILEQISRKVDALQKTEQK
jgi:hypothetical protein